MLLQNRQSMLDEIGIRVVKGNDHGARRHRTFPSYVRQPFVGCDGAPSQRGNGADLPCERFRRDCEATACRFRYRTHMVIEQDGDVPTSG